MTADPNDVDQLAPHRERLEQIRRRGEAEAAGSPRFAVLAGVAALLLCGMLFGASLWVLAAVAAAILIGVNFYLAKTWARSPVATRTGGDVEVKIGQCVPVEISITNRGPIPILWMLVEDLLPRRATDSQWPTLKIRGQRLAVMLLQAGQTRKLRYEIDCHRRGYIQIGPTVLETGDLMGLYRRYRLGAEPQFVTVLPDVLPLTDYEIGSKRPVGEIRVRENVMDDPTRLRGIRRWQPGDPMRRVHWAATARTGTLHTKIYEPSSIAGATLILDLHQQTNPAGGEPVRTDLAITAAASIAASLHDSGEPVGLATNGRDAADRVRREGWIGDHRVRAAATDSAAMRDRSDRLRPILLAPRRGPTHLQELMRTLARLERTDALTLEELVLEGESDLSSETTLLFIVQQASEAGLAALIGLARRGRAVAVIINTHDINDYSTLAGPLIATRVPTFHLSAPETLPDVCRQTLLR